MKCVLVACVQESMGVCFLAAQTVPETDGHMFI